MQHDQKTLYELKGKSLAAALTLHEKVLSELMPALHASAKGPVLKGFRDQYKDLFDSAGLNSRAIKIHVIQGCHPRAYSFSPEIYFHPADRTRAYMYTPTDFKGRSFVPQDGLRLSAEETKIISMGLWAGGWSSPEPVVQGRAPHGVQMPVDFDPNDPAQNFSYADAPFDKKTSSKLLSAMERSKPFYIADNAIAGVTDPEEFTFKCILICEDNGRPGLLAKAMRHSDGTALTMKPNAFFTPQAVGTDGFYKLTPHPKTAGGGAFKSFFDAIPSMSAEEVWKACDAADLANFIMPPPPPLALQQLRPTAPWPFPTTAPAP